jgi:hypothetical protein
MIQTKEVYLVTVEFQPMTDGVWDGKFPSHWIVKKFYTLSSAIIFYRKYAYHENTVSCFVSAPIQSLNTVALTKWEFESVDSIVDRELAFQSGLPHEQFDEDDPQYDPEEVA